MMLDPNVKMWLVFYISLCFARSQLCSRCKWHRYHKSKKSSTVFTTLIFHYLSSPQIRWVEVYCISNQFQEETFEQMTAASVKALLEAKEEPGKNCSRALAFVVELLSPLMVVVRTGAACEIPTCRKPKQIPNWCWKSCRRTPLTWLLKLCS